MEIKLYKKITFNPQNKKRTVNILNSPELGSKVIGQIMHGNIIEIYEIHELNWNKIKCGEFIGFIQIEVGTNPPIPHNSTLYIINKKVCTGLQIPDRGTSLQIPDRGTSPNKSTSSRIPSERTINKEKDDTSRDFLDDIVIIPRNGVKRNSILRTIIRNVLPLNIS